MLQCKRSDRAAVRGVVIEKCFISNGLRPIDRAAPTIGAIAPLGRRD